MPGLKQKELKNSLLMPNCGAAELSDEERELILQRLKLAREMVGETDALQWFGSWKTPDER